MTLRLLLLITAAGGVAAQAEKFWAVGGNASLTIRDQGKKVMAWVAAAEAKPTGNQSGNISVGEPLMYIEDFQLVDITMGSALIAFDESSQHLFLLGEQPRDWNTTVAGSMRIAVVDTSARPKLLHMHDSLPIVNMWRSIPLDDPDGHASFMQIWKGKLVLGGPTAEKVSIGFNLNFTVFVLDPETLQVEQRFKIPLSDGEIVQGPVQLDATASVIHFLVDCLYSGQRIYHLSLPSGTVEFSAVPDYYWSTLVYVPAAKALFGPAKHNEEARQGMKQGTANVHKASAESSWHWARYDLDSKTFSNSSMNGIACAPIDNPEDNTQNIAGLLPGRTGDVYLGMTCQPDASDINAALAIIDYSAATVKGLWTFAGLYYPEALKGLWHMGSEQRVQDPSLFIL